MTDKPALVEQVDRDCVAEMLRVAEFWPGHVPMIAMVEIAARHRQPPAARVAELEAENARLRECLASFRFIANTTDREPPNASVMVNVNLCRKARDLLGDAK